MHVAREYDTLLFETKDIEKIDENYLEELREIKKEYKKIKSTGFDKKFNIEIQLNPNNIISVPDSSTYDLNMFDYYAVLLNLRIIAINPDNNEEYEYNYLFRYSQYEPPEGWIRVG